MMRGQPKPKVQLRFLLQDVEDPVNVGAAFRIADAAGADIILTGISARPPHKLITKVGRAKDRRVQWKSVDDVEVAIDEIRADGFEVFAVELTPDAVAYNQVQYPEKTCLLVGHEDHGVTKKALARANSAIYIPMYGKGASLNVHVALAATAFYVLHGA